MSRPIKYRHVCKLPQSRRFGPLDAKGLGDIVSLTVDEYESIRLIDLERFTQEECAIQMNVARTTVQGIYAEARNKIAKFLVEGLMLSIDGGEYRLCDNLDGGCGQGCRYHHPGQGRGLGRGKGQGQGRGQSQGQGRGQGQGSGRPSRGIGINRIQQDNTIKIQEDENENRNTGQ
ncbi:MAG: DUF134 domain-containing protein [Clostridiales bacterium]|nr:DUF134 domain-containing protein [Clostridiales bacterium]